MLLAAVAIVSGLALLVWGADRFVTGAAALASNLGVPPLLIGLTVVGFGTSAPEILVAVIAALQGNPGLAIGNAIGSNIANIALILGVTALVAPLTVESGMLRREYPLLLIVSVLVFLLLYDGALGQIDGALLLTGLVASMGLLIWLSRQPGDPDPLATEIEAELPPRLGSVAASGWFLLGLVVLVAGSRSVVWGSVEVATALGVSDLIVGLTIVAVGTSLPELAASIVRALKNEHELAIGNVVGSNLWNLLAVLSAPGLLAPGLVPSEVLIRDMPIMLLLTLALLLMGRSARTRGIINRVEGGLLLSCFLTYQGWLVWQAHTASV